LIGDSSKAKQKLKWRPKVNVKKLAEMMYDADLQLLKGEK
jgi:GDP-D-mannose dehydratase